MIKDGRKSVIGLSADDVENREGANAELMQQLESKEKQLDGLKKNTEEYVTKMWTELDVLEAQILELEQEMPISLIPDENQNDIEEVQEEQTEAKPANPE